MLKRKTFYFAVVLVFCSAIFSAQFTITNSLKTANAADLKIGDAATLTAVSGADPMGAGWLRLTSATPNQKGYMYVRPTFPTNLGVIADFEYITWRNSSDVHHGADGFAFFLFDGAVTEANFKLGGYGGSLGYATFSNPANTTGLSGGYVGVGFDEYGNYARAAENRNGGTTELVPNSIVLRGPTSPTYNLSNPYLTHVALGDRSGSLNDIRQRNEVDYNVVSATRPASSLFYRRVQIYVTRETDSYRIRVQWRKENETTFTEILNYSMSSTTYPLPPTLRLGYAASTGGGYNFHEIRNILITTPGNIRVDSRSNFASICNDSNQNDVVFKIEVTNDTAVALTDIDFTNRLENAAGNLLDPGQFKISSLSTTGFTNSNLPTTNFTSNQISGKVGLAAKKSGIVTITGRYFKRSLPNNQNFKSVTRVNSTQITDIDETNNVATTLVNVQRCNIMTNPSMPAYNR